MKQLFAKDVLIWNCQHILAIHEEATKDLMKECTIKTTHKRRVCTKKLRAYTEFILSLTPQIEWGDKINLDAQKGKAILNDINKLYKLTWEYRARELFLSEIDMFEPLLQEHWHRVTKHIKKESSAYVKKTKKALKKFRKQWKKRHQTLFLTLEAMLKPHPITNITYWRRTYQRDIMGWIAQTVHQPNDKITSETMHDIRKKSKKMMYVSQRIEAVQSEYIPLYQARSDELGYVNDAADRIEYLEAYMKKIWEPLPHVNRYHAAHEYDKEQVLEHFRYFFKME